MSKEAIFRAYLAAALLLLLAVVWANSGEIQWADNGMFLVRAADNPYFTPDLSEMSHPLFNFVSVLVSRLMGASGLAWLNAVLMPVVAALIYVLARQMALSRRMSLATVCASLSVHCVLWVATKVEVYALHLVLVLACWCVYFSASRWLTPWRRLVVLGLLTGLALATHQLTLVVLAPMALVLFWRERLRMIWYGLGAALGMFASAPAVYARVLAGESAWLMVRGFLTGGVKADGHSWEFNFLRLDQLIVTPHLVASVLLSLFGVGVFGLLSKPTDGRQRLLWWSALLNLVFAATYEVPDRFTFFLPGAVLFVLLGVLSIQRGDWRWVRSTMVVPIALCSLMVYHLVPFLAADALLRLPRVKHPAPMFNPLMYYFVPLVPDRSAERFVATYEAVVPRGAVVYADFLSYEALHSAQKIGRFQGRDVRSCDVFDPAEVMQGPTYVVQELGCKTVMPYRAGPVAIGYKVRALP